MKKITLLIYNVNNEKYPFVTIGVVPSSTFELPVIDLDEDIPYEKDDFVVELSKKYLTTILSSYLNVEIKYIDEMYEDDNLVLMFEITMNHANSYMVTSLNKIWFATLHEILNTGEFCNIGFSEDVVNLVKTNVNYFLELGQVPQIKYDGSNAKKMAFESVFGVSRRDENDGLGNIFRFYDFETACKRAGEFKPSAILRYAVFNEDSYEDFLPITLHPFPFSFVNI